MKKLKLYETTIEVWTLDHSTNSTDLCQACLAESQTLTILRELDGDQATCPVPIQTRQAKGFSKTLGSSNLNKLLLRSKPGKRLQGLTNGTQLERHSWTPRPLLGWEE